MLILLVVGLLLVLPQLAGLLVTRVARQASWSAWPAAAIAVFGAVFYWWLWAPAAARAEASETRCGNWSLGLGFILLLGLSTWASASCSVCWPATGAVRKFPNNLGPIRLDSRAHRGLA